MKFRKLLILTILTICFSAFQTFACLQPAGSLVVGKPISIEGVSADKFMKNFLTHADRAYWENVRVELESQNKNSPLFSSNNLAVALVHLGQIPEAIRILEGLERQKPGEYFTAANLGTAYELNGENQKALNWIKEGIKRKEESHFGTEWLHVKILEVKLAIEKAPNWMKTHSVLGLDFSRVQKAPDAKIYLTDFSGQQRSLSEVEEALIYQLHERLEFVKVPEPIVGDLLDDLSRVFAISRTAEHSKAIEELAIRYGINPAEKAKSKNFVSPEPITSSQPTTSGQSNRYLYYAAIVFVVLSAGAVFFLVFRARKRALR